MIIIIIIIVVARRRWKKQQGLCTSSSTVTSVNSPADKDEAIANVHYAKTTDVVTVTGPSNIYDIPYSTNVVTVTGPSNIYDNPCSTAANVMTDHAYDNVAPQKSTKKTSSSSLHLPFAQRKESKSRYERLSAIEIPEDNS